MRQAHIAVLLAAGLILAALPACSFSRSSRSSSRSSASSSRSSSRQGAAPAATSQANFQEEIAAIAVLYVGRDGTADDFQRAITAAADRNGVPYWELDERVFTAIGIGLKRAGVAREAIPSVPFLQGVRNAAHFHAIEQAYAIP
jgi:hypothetical protein